jgi:hypothetical protein
LLVPPYDHVQPQSAVRLLPAFFTLHVAAAALCAAQSSETPANGVEVSVGTLHAIALDVDQRRDPLYCYFGYRVLTPAVRVHVDSVTTVPTMEACGGIGFGFVMRSTDRDLLIQMLRGVIDNNPRFAVVSAFYATEDVDRFGDKVRVARTLSIVRGVATTSAAASGLPLTNQLLSQRPESRP